MDDALQEALFKNLMLVKDVEIERSRSKTWQKLAGRYDDIRDWLRICQDTPDGHAEFYKRVCLLIFGEYRDEVDEDGELWPGQVGFLLTIPGGPQTVPTEVGPRPEGPGVRQRREQGWCDDLDRVAKMIFPGSRVQIQPERTDRFGLYERDAIIWCEPEVDISEMRERLHARGYAVRSASIYYEPAMA